jgi:hypothetical protein
MWITIPGWPVEPVSQLSPLKNGKYLILFFSGKRANGQRAQPVLDFIFTFGR